ncbi:pseudouridine synthase [Chytriomyces sp. MP71]|nr:pseudouridine synthase [Chytriomyces sp. MP71]
MGRKRRHDASNDTRRPPKHQKMGNRVDAEPSEAPAQFEVDSTLGLRRVVPYWWTHRVMAKGRWWQRELLEVYCKEFNDHSPQYFKDAIETGRIRVNGEIKDGVYRLRNGDAVSHRTHRHEPPIRCDQIRVVFADDDMLVVDKPPSIPVHPSGRYNHNTVLGILKSPEYGYSNLFSVNRIDRLTSGILLLARNKEKAAQLAAELADRNVQKTYLCRVRGLFPSEPIHCTEPIRVESNKLGINMVHPDGRQCETTFTLLHQNASSNTSVVLCEPKTGRTHQIRVHLQWLGYPIWNDPLYCNEEFWGPELGKGGVLDPEAVLERIRCAKVLNDLGDGGGEGAWTGGDGERLPVRDGVKAGGSTSLKPAAPESSTEDSASLNEASLDVNNEQREGVRSEEGLKPALDQAPDDACHECSIHRPDPDGSKLCIYLHAWKYSGDGWAYETPMPDWASPDFVDEA